MHHRLDNGTFRPEREKKNRIVGVCANCVYQHNGILMAWLPSRKLKSQAPSPRTQIRGMNSRRTLFFKLRNCVFFFMTFKRGKILLFYTSFFSAPFPLSAPSSIFRGLHRPHHHYRQTKRKKKIWRRTPKVYEGKDVNRKKIIYINIKYVSRW